MTWGRRLFGSYQFEYELAWLEQGPRVATGQESEMLGFDALLDVQYMRWVEQHEPEEYARWKEHSQ